MGRSTPCERRQVRAQLALLLSLCLTALLTACASSHELDVSSPRAFVDEFREARCARGYRCADVGEDAGLCVRTRLEGERCGAGDRCGDELRCEGVCGPRRAGDACITDDQCDGRCVERECRSGFRGEGQSCDDEPWACAPPAALRLGGRGARLQRARLRVSRRGPDCGSASREGVVALLTAAPRVAKA